MSQLNMGGCGCSHKFFVGANKGPRTVLSPFGAP